MNEQSGVGHNSGQLDYLRAFISDMSSSRTLGSIGIVDIWIPDQVRDDNRGGRTNDQAQQSSFNRLIIKKIYILKKLTRFMPPSLPYIKEVPLEMIPLQN